jgi:nucleoside-diphosphate-sugar epimerase
MRVFLTGGTGFVGSHLLNELRVRGCEVTALRRPGSRPRVELSNQPEWIEGAMDELPRGVLRRTDVVVHLAAHSANVPYDSLEACLFWNLQTSLRVVQQAAEEGVARFIIAGTCFEYGRAGERYEFIPTNAPLEPVESYSTSKAAASVALMGLARMAGLSLSYHRIFQVFGEGEAESRFWPSLRLAASRGEDFPMSPGQQMRDFIPVEDVARHFANELLLEPPSPGEPLIRHVGTGKATSLLDFARHWWRVWGASGKLRPGAKPYRLGEVMRYVAQV